MQLTHSIGIIQCTLQDAEQNNQKQRKWKTWRSTWKNLIVLVVSRPGRVTVSLTSHQWACPHVAVVINLLLYLCFCLMLHRAHFLFARGVLVAEGVEGCAYSPPAQTACISFKLFRALPLDMCVWLMVLRILHWGFMEGLSWKKAGIFSWAGADYLFPPRNRNYRAYKDPGGIFLFHISMNHRY